MYNAELLLQKQVKQYIEWMHNESHNWGNEVRSFAYHQPQNK